MTRLTFHFLRVSDRLTHLSVMLLLATCLMETVQAAEPDLPWPFRNGPTMNGHVAAADAKGLPTSFDENAGRNVRWKVTLEGFGHSAPIIGDRRIWLTSATEDGHQQFVDCFHADTGDVLHRRLLFENPEPEPLNNKVNTYASPSCALESDAVYVHFGSYGTARLNPETADVVWKRTDIQCRHFRGPGSSPILFGDLLILTFDGVDADFLIALNKATGETVWRTERSTDYGDLDENGKPQRDGDLRKAYSTPGLIEVNGRTQVVSMGSRAGFGYDALTGKEIWGIRHDDFNAASPPCFFENLAIMHSGTRAKLFAVELNETTKGDVTDSHIRWTREKSNSKLAAPLLIGNRLFMISDTGVVNCVDAATGEEIWKDRLGGTHVASPITANGVIWFCSEEGELTAVKAADQFEIIAQSQLTEGMRASLSAAYGRLYLRTFRHLYCIGQ
ncbi:MAG: PQQ-binding-like beta-propeller repeat protein [Planctomycetaceae bacterium]